MGIDLAKLRKKFDEMSNNNKGFNVDEKYVRWTEGSNVIRILPPLSADSGDWYAETAIHRLPSTTGRDNNVHCPRVQDRNASCPICDHVNYLWGKHRQWCQDNGKDSRDWNVKSEYSEEARKIKAKKRFYMNVIQREVIKEDEDGKKEVVHDYGPSIAAVGIKLFKMIIGVMVDEDYGDITDIVDGTDFDVHKSIVSEYPNYDQSKPKRKASPAGTKEQIKEWLENLYDLRAEINIKSIDEMNALFNDYINAKSGNTSDQTTNSHDMMDSSDDDEQPTSNVERFDETKTSSSDDKKKSDKDRFREELERVRTSLSKQKKG